MHNLLLIVIILLQTLLFGLCLYFTGGGIDDSFLYHLSTGVRGAGLMKELSALIPIIIFSLLLSIFLVYISMIWKPFWIILLLIAIFHPINISFFQYITYKGETVSNINIATQVGASSETVKKNVVWIYLESMEQLHLDDELFPGMAPHIRNLQENNISFTNVKQTMGTNWTIGGIVGSQCGVPLIGSLKHANHEKFLQNAVCFPDLLSSSGYKNTYIGGADTTFANKSKYLKTHSYSIIKGLGEISFKHKPHEWGLYDIDTLSHVMKEFKKLSATGEPFMLTTLTLDTHGNSGTPSPHWCGDDNGITEAYKCTDRLVGGLVRAIQRTQYAENTIIVLSSDHYAMNHNETHHILKKHEQERREIFIIIDGEKATYHNEGNMLDVGATVLDRMGMGDNIGLGKSLFSTGSLSEKYDNVDGVLRTLKPEIEELW